MGSACREPGFSEAGIKALALGPVGSISRRLARFQAFRRLTRQARFERQKVLSRFRFVAMEHIRGNLRRLECIESQRQSHGRGDFCCAAVASGRSAEPQNRPSASAREQPLLGQVPAMSALKRS